MLFSIHLEMSFYRSENSYCNVISYDEECSSSGHLSILDEDECEMASKAIDVPYGGTETYSDYPKGCYTHFGDDEFSSETYWNKHATGKLSTPGNRKLCHKYIGKLT